MIYPELDFTLFHITTFTIDLLSVVIKLFSNTVGSIFGFLRGFVLVLKQMCEFVQVLWVYILSESTCTSLEVVFVSG